MAYRLSSTSITVLFQSLGKRTGKEKSIHSPILPDQLSFPFPLPPIFRTEVCMPWQCRRLKNVTFIMGSQLKSRGGFSAQEAENWWGNFLANFPTNHRRSLNNQENNDTLWSLRESFVLFCLKFLRKILICHWKWKSLSRIWLFVTLFSQIIVCQAPLSMDSPGKDTGVGSHSLLQGIFLTKGSNCGLLHCRQILNCLSHQGSSSLPLGLGYSWNIFKKPFHLINIY